MYYANRVHEILKQKSYYNQSPEFDVTEKVHDGNKNFESYIEM